MDTHENRCGNRVREAPRGKPRGNTPLADRVFAEPCEAKNAILSCHIRQLAETEDPPCGTCPQCYAQRSRRDPQGFAYSAVVKAYFAVAKLLAAKAGLAKKGKMVRITAAFLCLLALMLPSCCRFKGGAPALVLVQEGKSAYSIYVDTSAPSSVKTGAEELQRVIRISTGVNLPIVNTPTAPMICLGDNAASREAGVSSEGIPDEGFRIKTRGGNIYIVGKDWLEQDKKWEACDSTGTLFGIYDFLERFLGVRWLMPGDLGEDIPRHAGKLTIPAVDIADAPLVACRNLGVPNDKPDVRAWLRRNRIGRSILPASYHNFADNPSTEVLKAHPEYMPLQADGTREKPVGNRKWGEHEHKLCLSNPGLIQAFADSLMEGIKKRPKRQVSAAPADDGHWCVCPECQKYKITDTNGVWGDFQPYGYSMTPLVLHFYNGVARIIGQKYPDQLVGGVAYHQYVYPPYEPTRIEPNVHIEIAINAGYGFKFYKPETAARVQQVITAWARIAPHLGWSDYSTWMRNAFGAPLPPGLPILKTIFPAFGKSMTTINYTGQTSWGYGAAHNYLIAKLMWNNNADIDALYHEYLDRAYGPAAVSMDRMYNLVEEYLKKYIIEKPYPDHEIWYDTAVKVYAPIYDQIEQLYVQALAQARTKVQRKRLEMLGDNLVMFNWNMRHAGLIKTDEKSILYRSDADYDKFLLDRTNSIAIENLAGYKKWGWQMALWSPEVRILELTAMPAKTAAPRIDGNLTDEAWETAIAADQFRTTSGQRDPAKHQTVARVTYDAENLYVAFECVEDEPAKILKECVIRNSESLFADDYVSVVIQPPGEKHLELAVNARGNIACRKGGTPQAAPATVQTAAAIGGKNWTMEMMIPFKELGLAGSPTVAVWRGNFVRRRTGAGKESSTWCRVEGYLVDPRTFGELRFPVK